MTSGSITVAEMPYYNVFCFQTGSGSTGEYAIGLRGPSGSDGVAFGILSTATACWVNAFYFTISGTKLTWKYGDGRNLAGDISYDSDNQIKKIYGIL